MSFARPACFLVAAPPSHPTFEEVEPRSAKRSPREKLFHSVPKASPFASVRAI